MKKIVLFFIILAFSFFLGTKASADEYQELQKQINDLTTALNLSINATRPLQSELDRLQTRIRGIKERVAVIEDTLITKRQNIDKGYKNLEKQKDTLNKTIVNYYIKSYYNSPFVVFLSNSSAVKVVQNLAFQKALADQDREKIVNFALLLTDLENQKKSLESEETQLSSLKLTLDEQSGKLNKIVSGARAYQSSLSSQIAQLSARQQEILGQRLAALGIPLYASMTGGCSSDLTNGKDPGFGGGFGLFTYGVPNRVGLSQFGAWGRAKAGQDQDTILHAYYNFDSVSNVDQNIQIHVQGNGIDWTGSVEDYVKRIYEVPDSWTDNNLAALKAQAIAVRSYALAYTNNGQNPICPTDKCQVFQTNEKGGNWSSATSQTAGKVMVQGGSPIKAWFSSTHGGYVFSSGDIGWSPTTWTKNAQDTTSPVASFSDLKSNAYDKDSPWFYCDWGARSSYGGTAWLKNDEIADIVNVLLLAQKDSSVREHLYQPDKPNPAGTDTWDSGRIRSELQNRGGTPFNNISSASVDWDKGSGRTNTVSLSGDAGTASFSGSDFKTYFNLRAPANIQIVGPLYNIEHR